MTARQGLRQRGRDGGRRTPPRGEFIRPDHALIDHRVYGIVSDGDLQEGIASEAASLAGPPPARQAHLLYDDNGIQLDGPTSMAWSEDPQALRRVRLRTQRVEDGNDLAAIAAAIETAQADGRQA